MKKHPSITMYMHAQESMFSFFIVYFHLNEKQGFRVYSVVFELPNHE